MKHTPKNSDKRKRVFRNFVRNFRRPVYILHFILLNAIVQTGLNIFADLELEHYIITICASALIGMVIGLFFFFVALIIPIGYRSRKNDKDLDIYTNTQKIDIITIVRRNCYAGLSIVALIALVCSIMNTTPIELFAKFDISFINILRNICNLFLLEWIAKRPPACEKKMKEK